MVRVLPDPPLTESPDAVPSAKLEEEPHILVRTSQIGYGAVAQLGEHLLCKQGVTGSIPVSSTSFGRRNRTAHTNLYLSDVEV